MMRRTSPSDGWRQRVTQIVIAQLSQGITAEKLALTVALAAALGIFPILGATTALCGFAALALRLNQPLIQFVNYLLTPVQLLLLLPFYRAGESLFGQAPVPIFSVEALLLRFEASPRQFVADYGRVGLYGIVVWGLIAPPLVGLLYLLLRPLFTNLSQRLAIAR